MEIIFTSFNSDSCQLLLWIKSKFSYVNCTRRQYCYMPLPTRSCFLIGSGSWPIKDEYLYFVWDDAIITENWHCDHRVDRVDITIIILDTTLVPYFVLHANCFSIAGNRPVHMRPVSRNRCPTPENCVPQS